jgi:hypothetical protein
MTVMRKHESFWLEPSSSESHQAPVPVLRLPDSEGAATRDLPDVPGVFVGRRQHPVRGSDLRGRGEPHQPETGPQELQAARCQRQATPPTRAPSTARRATKAPFVLRLTPDPSQSAENVPKSCTAKVGNLLRRRRAGHHGQEPKAAHPMAAVVLGGRGHPVLLRAR